jgi:hypothetical protein
MQTTPSSPNGLLGEATSGRLIARAEDISLIDLTGPSAHTSPEDPDFDVTSSPLPGRQSLRIASSYSSSGKWNKLEPAKSGVRTYCVPSANSVRFRLQIPWVSWEQAEDYAQPYIFSKFRKINFSGIRCGKPDSPEIRENHDADVYC